MSRRPPCHPNDSFHSSRSSTTLRHPAILSSSSRLGPKRNPLGLQQFVSEALPAIFLLGAPLLAADVLLRGTADSTTMLGWYLLLLGFFALLWRHVAVAATVLGMAYVVGGYVVWDLVLLSEIVILVVVLLKGAVALLKGAIDRFGNSGGERGHLRSAIVSLKRALDFSGNTDLVQDDALRLPCPLVAVRTPEDEASLVIGLGQGLERVFHLAAGWIGALGQRFKRLYSRRPAEFYYVLLIAVQALYLRISPRFAVTAVWITPIFLSALPTLVLGLLTGREALALPGITGVDAEPLPFAEPESLMTLVIDVEAGRKRPKGLTHSLHEVPAIRSRIACWIRRAILHPMNTGIDLERQILALPAAERERLATVAWESLGDDPSAARDRNIDAEGIEIAAQRDAEIESGQVQPISHADFLRHTGGVSE